MSGSWRTTREARVLRGGLVAIAGIVLVGRGFPAMQRAGQQLRLDVRETERALRVARLKASELSGTRPPTGESADSLALLRAVSPAGAVAAVVAYVTDVALASGVALHSARPSGDSAFRGGVAQVNLDVVASAGTRAAAEWISRLETGAPFFRVGAISIVQPSPAVSAQFEEVLRLELRLESAVQLDSLGTGETRRTRSGRDAQLRAIPFRLDHGRIAPPAPEPMRAASPVVTRPSWTVRAIVGGPPWRALLRGVPPASGERVVQPGDRLGATEVRAIGPDFVVLFGMDTSWTLTLPAVAR
ncbi:MAG: hypothetical protein KJZ74_06395 [Gemmatimonadales bacterium]|nr:hypothetical protein [Gemmatimonadales bacterium]